MYCTQVSVTETSVQICTRVSLIATRVSYASCQYQYSRTHPFDIRNNKTWLMDICWALIINYINCLNLLNLQNRPISQSINRGLGEGIKRMNLKEKSYAGGISSEFFGAIELRVLWLQRSPLFRRWVVHLSHSLIVNKENSSSNFMLSLFHVSWLMNIFHQELYMLFI